jgi:hypothetical protein
MVILWLAEKVSGASDTRREKRKGIFLLLAEANEVGGVPKTSPEKDLTGRSWCIRNGLI